MRRRVGQGKYPAARSGVRSSLAHYIRYGYSAVVTRASDPRDLVPLTPVVLHTLLALADGERHGYAIAQDVEQSTSGQIRMGPGTLYGSIQRMLTSGLIEETQHRLRAGEVDDERRRYYRMTATGRRALEIELRRLADVVRVARAKRLLRDPELA